MADDARSSFAAWRVMMLVGLVGNAVGLIGGIPILTLISAPVALVGAIGFLATRRKAQAAPRRRP